MISSSTLMIFLLTVAHGQGSRDTRQDERIADQAEDLSGMADSIGEIEDEVDTLKQEIATARAERNMMIRMLQNIHECLIGPYEPLQEVGENQ